jgi:hypothetical protein
MYSGRRDKVEEDGRSERVAKGNAKTSTTKREPIEKRVYKLSRDCDHVFRVGTRSLSCSHGACVSAKEREIKSVQVHRNRTKATEKTRDRKDMKPT